MNARAFGKTISAGNEIRGWLEKIAALEKENEALKAKVASLEAQIIGIENEAREAARDRAYERNLRGEW